MARKIYTDQAIKQLEDHNKALLKKVKHYVKLLDDQYGTPCEQIRHQQEIEEIKTKFDPITRLQNGGKVVDKFGNIFSFDNITLSYFDELSENIIPITGNKFMSKYIIYGKFIHSLFTGELKPYKTVDEMVREANDYRNPNKKYVI